MNVIKNLLATAIIASSSLLPQANAAIALGNITPGANQADWGASFGGNPPVGSFDAIFTFTVNNLFSEYDITSSVITSASTFSGKADTFTAFALEDSVGNILELGTVGIDATGRAYAALPDDFFIGNGDYRLELTGTSSGKIANYGASLSVSISPVPEAEEWAMLLLGLPMLSLAVRRKQA